MAVKKPSVSEWFREQLREQLRLEAIEGGEPFRRALASFPVLTGVKAAPTPLTGGLRYMSRFLKTRMRFPIGHEGYSCVVLGLKTRRARSIYGLALWRSGAEAGDPEYICASPTFESRDGEYRYRLVGFAAFAAAFAELAGPLAPFEDAILAEVGRGRLELTATAYPDRAAPDLVEACERLRLPVIALAALLAIEAAPYADQIIVEHTNVAFVKCFQDIIEAAPKLEEASRVIWDTEALVAVLLGFITGTPANTNRYEPEQGVKVVPMILREVMQPFDLNLAAWREASITQVASDLSLNLITPSFGVFGGWTYVEGTDAGLFENRAMAEKFARGAAAAGAAEGLREARRRLEAAPPGFRARDLGARLYETIEYAQSHLVLSEVAMLFAQEHVGITLGSAPLFARRDPFARPALRDFAATRDGAARLLFEWAYAAHCLHAKAGVAHCDLHENNLTLHIWGSSSAAVPASLRESGKGGRAREAPPIYGAATPVTFFVTGERGELDTFVFPTSGLGGYIIDYSRAVLGPAYRPRLEAGHDPLYASNFYRDQVNRAMRVLHRYSKDFVQRNQEALKAVAIADFGALFPVLCAVDFIAVGAAFASALEKAAARDQAERDPARPGLGTEGRHLRPLAVDPAAVDLARLLEKAGREALVAGLLDLVGGGRAAAPPPWPGESVLPKVFGRWRYPRWVERTQAERLAARPGRAGGAAGAGAGAGAGGSAGGSAPPAETDADAVAAPPAEGAGATAAGPTAVGPTRPPPAYVISSLPPGPVLVDVYNFNNPVEYSGADYARFPPWARLDRIEPHLGDLKMTDLFERGPEPFFAALKPGVRPEVLAAQLRAEEERLDGRAVSTASSWLEEA
jgi:hypothetical protein